MKKYIIALDQGTSSSRSILSNKEGQILYISSRPIKQIYPKPNWVEQDPEEIWETQKETLEEVLQNNKIKPEEIAALGITNQRETFLLWHKKTGSPLTPAISWQCQRSISICENLKSQDLEPVIQSKTGLTLNPYFSASKLQWVFDNDPHLRQLANKGLLLFGTIDSWLLWRLTNGKIHGTDYSNASRTMLYNIDELTWDQELLQIFSIPESILPFVYPSGHCFGYTSSKIFGNIPIMSILGDQQASLFGQGGWQKGSSKITLGTGGFIMINTGKEKLHIPGLLSTIAWGENHEITYALEGSILAAGSVMKWLSKELGFLEMISQSSEKAQKATIAGSIVFVPALGGLGSPHWDPKAQGVILGIDRHTTSDHFIKGALDGIAFQCFDIFQTIKKESHLQLGRISVDGKMSQNDYLLQTETDLLQEKIHIPLHTESTAFGTTLLAGLQVGFWQKSDLQVKLLQKQKVYLPQKNKKKNALYHKWQKALQISLDLNQDH